MNGKDKLAAVVSKLKNEVVEKKESEEKIMSELKNELATIQANPELMQMYQSSGDIGAGNLSGEVPLLKVYSVGKSQAQLADGTKPKDGWFFYKPTGQQFQNPTCHILTISRGFRAEGMADPKTKKTEPKFNQVIGGVIMDGDKMLPFLMYFTGLKLQKLWEFAKEASKYTKMKPTPIPMFALSVVLGTETKTNPYGESWIVNFNIEKDDVGFPKLIMDTELFMGLREQVVKLEDTIASIIDAKSTEDQFGNPKPVESEDHEEVDIV